MRPSGTALLHLLLVVWVAGAAAGSDLAAASETDVAKATYIGARACGACHPDALRAWGGSHHDLAMQEATPKTVLGNFEGATHTQYGVTTRFTRDEGRYWIESEDDRGERKRFEAVYAFGVDPLQQYLVAFPDGRLQAFVLAWDTRPSAEGGQRWFSVYGDERIPPGDVLHWTGLAQNWNHQCAECHSTNLRKGYDAGRDQFETTWSEIDVACEACHGPGSVHRTRMQNGEGKWRKPNARGLSIEFEPVARARYRESEETGLPVREPVRTAHTEVELCARCHARRSTLAEGTPAGTPIHDTHRIATLDPPLYFGDGQIREEVYVYGSFVQSAMHAAGVSCSDCHEPHSARLRVEGNALCARCHTPTRYDTKEHHHHAQGSRGSQCVECHMPTRTYMQIDPRRDHSLRVPDPELAARVGAPNACNGCHTSTTSSWSARQIAGWRNAGSKARTHFGDALEAGRTGSPEAERKLAGLIDDRNAPDIARATAVSMLPLVATPNSLPTFERALSDGDPMLRAAGARALASAPAELRTAHVPPLLDDATRLVRWEAALALQDIDPASLGAAAAKKRQAILEEYERALQRDADRPESHMGLSSLALARGDQGEAEEALHEARKRNPSFVPAYVNLSDLYRAEGKHEQSEAVLREGLTKVPEHPDLSHALGLALVRLGRAEEALGHIASAAQSMPDNPRYAYVHAVALYDAGRVQDALTVLREAAARHPGDRNIAAFLASLEGRGRQP
ncbi:MAG: tetratricopeptide repeat protein [Myxococcota bacterium]|nr:tetratricopeptide repeat protein [Myxococcota bacterium]